jgi:hypothetical protein
MNPPLFWAIAHLCLFLAFSAIIVMRPGYWAGAMHWGPAALSMLTSTIKGSSAPKAAKARWQFTCLTCGALAALTLSICYLALEMAWPHAQAMVGLGRLWLLLVLVAFAFGSLSAGREADAG